MKSALMALLDDEKLVGNNLSLLSGSRKTVELLHPEDSPDRRALMAKWVEAAQRVENDETLPIHDRLDAIEPQIQLAEGEAAIYAELQDHVLELIAWAGAAVTDEGELQAMLLGLLESDYRSWNEDGTHDESLARIRGFVHQACERYPAEGEDSARARCAGFLAEEETEPV